MRVAFISDLHLSADDGATDVRFDRFLLREARTVDRLYVLGDLLHLWLGDALLATDHYAQSVCQRFASLVATGTKLYLMRGNRDFMIGDAFAAACRAELLPAETVVTLGRHRVLLMHGDELCTQDLSYQRARRVLRSPMFHTLADHLPVSLRRAIAARLRRASDAHKASTSMTMMDADEGAIDRAMSRHTVDTLIHGHTHRPATHALPDGRRRIVLTDWQQDHGFLLWDGTRFDTRPFSSGDGNVQSL